MSTVNTQFGNVSVDELVRVYQNHKQSIQKAVERRRDWLQTDQGKQYNRDRAKSYYERNKEAILEKRKTMYADKKELRRLAARQEQQINQPSE